MRGLRGLAGHPTMRARNVCFCFRTGDAGRFAVLLDLQRACFDVGIDHRAAALLQLTKLVDCNEAVFEAIRESDGGGVKIVLHLVLPCS